AAVILISAVSAAILSLLFSSVLSFLPAPALGAIALAGFVLVSGISYLLSSGFLSRPINALKSLPLRVSSSYVIVGLALLAPAVGFCLFTFTTLPVVSSLPFFLVLLVGTAILSLIAYGVAYYSPKVFPDAPAVVAVEESAGSVSSGVPAAQAATPRVAVAP